MSAVTHVTENALRAAVGLDRSVEREWARACDGETREGSPSEWIADLLSMADKAIPTCPRCAVLRDEALEGRLPVREAKP